MKLLFLLTYYYPHWTGLTQYAISLASGLAKNFSITVVTTQHEPTLPLHEDIDGVHVVRSPVWIRVSRTMISLRLLFTIPSTVRRCDRAVVFLPFAEVLWTALWARVWNKPLYLIHNGDLTLPAGMFNRIIEFIFRISTHLAIRLSRGIIVNTVDYARHSPLLSHYPHKWIPEVPPYPPLQENKLVTRSLKKRIGPTHAVVGFAGRFVQEKGFDILLAAIPLVVKKMPGVKFVFAGETRIPYEHTFEEHASQLHKVREHLVLLGKLSRKEMGSFYHIIDCLAISSRSDFFPFVQAEALQAGVPVVVTDIPGARWLVSTTKMGKVVPAEDPQSLAEGIIEVLKHKKSYTKFHPKVMSLLDFTATIARYEKLWK